MNDLLWFGLPQKEWLYIVAGASLMISLVTTLASYMLVDRDVMAQGVSFLGGDNLELRSVWGRGGFLFVGLLLCSAVIVLSDRGLDMLFGVLFFAAMVITGVEMLFPGALTPGSVSMVERYLERKNGELASGVSLQAKFSHRVPEGIAWLCLGVSLLGFSVRGWVDPWTFLAEESWLARCGVVVVPGVIGALAFIAGMFALFDGEYEQNLLVVTPDWLAFPAESKRSIRAIAWSDVHEIQCREDQELRRFHIEDAGGDDHAVYVSQAGGYLEALDTAGDTLGKMLLTGLPHREQFVKVLTELWRHPQLRTRLAESDAVAWVRQLAKPQAGETSSR